MPKYDFLDYKNMSQKISKFTFIKEHFFFLKKHEKINFFEMFNFWIGIFIKNNYLTYIC